MLLKGWGWEIRIGRKPAKVEKVEKKYQLRYCLFQPVALLLCVEMTRAMPESPHTTFPKRLPVSTCC